MQDYLARRGNLIGRSWEHARKANKGEDKRAQIPALLRRRLRARDRMDAGWHEAGPSGGWHA
jgi:hypothetical protein